MDWLEQELKQALERKEPSPDFAARVAAAARPGASLSRCRDGSAWPPPWWSSAEED